MSNCVIEAKFFVNEEDSEVIKSFISLFLEHDSVQGGYCEKYKEGE